MNAEPTGPAPNHADVSPEEAAKPTERHRRPAGLSLLSPETTGSPIGLRLAGVILSAILLAGLTVLIPLYLQRQEALRTELRARATQLIVANADGGRMRNAATLAERLLRNPLVAGVKIVDDSGVPIIERGEPIGHGIAAFGPSGRELIGVTGDRRLYEATWMPGETPVLNRIDLSLDGHLLDKALDQHALRDAALLLAAAIVATLAVMMTISAAVLRPFAALREANDRLRRRASLLQAYFDYSPSMNTLKALDGTYLMVNKAMEEHWRMPAADFIGRLSRELLPPDIAAILEAQEREAIEQKRTVIHEIHPTLPDGRSPSFENIKFPVLNDRDDVIATGSTSVDVTERRNAEAALKVSWARLQTVLANMDQGVILYDKDLRVALFNQQAGAVMALPENILQEGAAFADLVRYVGERGDMPKELAASLTEEARMEAIARTAHRAELRLVDGRIIEVRRIPVPDGGFVATQTDITERKAMENALREGRQRLTDILDSSPFAVSIVDAEGRRLYGNSRMAELLDMDPDDLVGGQKALITEPGDLARIEALYRTDGAVRDFDVELQMSGDRTLWVTCTIAPIEFGTIPAQISWVYEITARKRAEAETARQRQLLDQVLRAVGQGVVMYDSRRRLEVWNDHLREFLRLTKDMMVPGRHIRELMTIMGRRGDYGEGDVDALVDARLRQLWNGEAGRSEILIEGEQTYDVLWQPTEDDGLVITYTDITERKLGERDLRLAMERAEAMAHAKSEVVAVVSHEIRTPMNGVLGMASVLRESNLDASQRRYVDIILSAGESLLRIVDDLLDNSKLEAGKLELDPIPFVLGELVDNSASALATQAVEKGLSLDTRIDPSLPEVLIGDPFRLRQVLLNLVSNALKFTETGGVQISVEVAAREEERATIAFAVADTGRGISPDVQARLFSPYMQESVEVARRYGGTGLGLAICRRLVELMGGEIELDSEVGRGSTFHFTLILPIDRETDAAALRSTSPGHVVMQGGPRLRLLQVEDNAINRDVLEQILGRAGHEVVSVVNGIQALRAIRDGEFDAILMDRHMPEMDGIDATRQIRAAAEPWCAIPIIGITAGASPSERDDCLAAGMDAVTTKPVNVGELLQMLGRLTSGAQAGRQRRLGAPVLVVDDTPINLVVAAEILDQLGIPHEVADRGALALDKLERRDFAMVLVDISMPEMDGLELAARIRAREAEGAHRLPIIAVTGHAATADRERYSEAGVDGVLAKPFTREELERVIQTWFANASTSDATRQESRRASVEAEEPPIDLSVLATLLAAGDSGKPMEFARLFAKEIPDYVSAIHRAVGSRDVGALQSAAHRARGAAAQVGAGPMQRLLSALEAEAASANWPPLQSLLAELDKEMQRVQAFVQSD